jgi:hypothetical protein
MFRSLVGGMAAWRVVETLSKTGGFGVQVTRRRLLETLQHFLEVNEDIEAVKPGGRGFASSVRVRLLHAMVRRRIMRLAAETPSYFDTEALGAPINDLHQMGTISVYSTAVLFVALPAQGVRLSERQTADYLALWRWVGHVMGTPVDYMASPQTAKAMLESIMCSEFDPSINSQIIANNILSAEADMPPYRLPRGFLCAQAHRLIGSTQAIALGIEMPSLRNRLFVELQSVFLWLYALPYPILPAAGKEARRQRFLKLGWDVINNRKTGGRGEASKFDMQFIPELGKTTELVPIKVAARLKPTTGATLAIALAFIVVSFMAVVGLVQTSPAWLDMVPRPSVSPFLMQA